MPAMDYASVAELYDVYVQTAIDVPFFLQEAQGCSNVLELTSGTGRLSLPLVEAGIVLSCLDSSPEMLAILRRKLQAQGLSAPVYEMDITNFALPHTYDLIIIPFNAFAELTDPAAQQAALAAIHAHLSDAGCFICTLHNPAVRLRNVDGQIRLRGKFALPDKPGALFLSSVENYHPGASLVTGAQFYELYDADGVLQSKRFVDVQFYVHSREAFEALVEKQGYKIEVLYGDYARAAFDPQASPFMIWKLRKG
ncbi:MAG: class I SAM-dependent methyltransferase [Anaerolineae bacterium]|nr:class I SAM-dependent methyltransferase [Anaerolineae bacterium]